MLKQLVIKRQRIAMLLACPAVLVAAPLAARERLLAPTDGWNVQQNDEDCSLSRTFADAQGKQVRLRIQNYGQWHVYRLTMIGDGLPLRDGTRGIARFKYRFKPDPDWREGFGTTGYIGGVDALTFGVDFGSSQQMERVQRALSRGEVPDSWPDYMRSRAAEIQQFALAYPSRDDTVLQIGSMSEPLAQLEQCADNLTRAWGYDPALLKSFQRLPRLTNGAQIGSALAAEMRRQGLGRNDSVQFRLTVDERGRAATCAIQHPRGENAVANLICEMALARAEIEPALDADGNPISAPLVCWVRFAIR